MRVLFDTNVVLDHLLARESYISTSGARCGLLGLRGCNSGKANRLARGSIMSISTAVQSGTSEVMRLVLVLSPHMREGWLRRWQNL